MGSIARHCMPPVKDILTNYNKKHPQTEYILISTYNIYGLICAMMGDKQTTFVADCIIVIIMVTVTLCGVVYSYGLPYKAPQSSKCCFFLHEVV